MTGPLDFESLVRLYYAPLYRFALSLTHQETDAADFTQETFHIWATRGHQLQDGSKVKTWLFTTLHRLFLQSRRRYNRFPHVELADVEEELPVVEPENIDRLDGHELIRLLHQMDERLRAPVGLFYLEDYPYAEIAEILGIPLGTVKSRIARGMAHLQQLVLARSKGASAAHFKQP